MRAALDVFWETVRDWYNGMVGLAVMNFAWLLCSLTVILLPPATAGIATVTNSIAHGTGAHFNDLWRGMQRYAWVSYRWALVNIAAAAIFVVCFSFYGAAGGTLGVFIQALFAVAGLVWIAVQFYVWPFLIEQENKRLRIALKNALFLTLANPAYTFILLGMAAVALVISLITMLPIAVFLTSFVTLLSSRAVIERLTAYGKLPGVVETGGSEEEL
jgi:hypothetical protein